MVTLSIIGTAGRDKTKKLTLDHFNYMHYIVEQFIDNNNLLDKEQKSEQKDTKSLTLVSGGAAWADHVAVDFFLKKSEIYDNDTLKLILYLPCKIVIQDGEHRYYDSGSKDWRVNPGKMSNTYHKAFGSVIGRDTIKEIVDTKATLDTTSKGFHARNTKVSKSDYIIAFTFGAGDQPEAGGTSIKMVKGEPVLARDERLRQRN
ncbi:hypothetical protein PPL_00006 [Heterostelium album PN500]|uniref:Uncharacterized protein n=1 Tax=Heterostelium pallidum (strain ATCC 26659 / Pp 5 / PN500) TaxID=670386 RepID=D3BVK5_HETP5|nr:hypothetical protein PPL_00006 [Heterostelium album PN500]EFA74508.1 hypothetical protein PPL_00006 [Heterostelium album PN500]|eukprot:XP_020426642.1 hypothetical protein PPL_00006 [Heterostelium album PN500]